MENVPTPEVAELCIKNSLRLLEDVLNPGVSLPTAGALSEIGLEEAAKGILILICLNKAGKISKAISIDLGQDLLNMIEKIDQFSKKVDCQKQLSLAFREHKVKTEFIRELGSLFSNTDFTKSDATRRLVSQYLKNIAPNLTDDNINSILSKPEILDKVRLHMIDIEEVIKGISERIKESGFYVDLKGKGFTYPEIEKNTTINMTEFLFSIIFAALKIADIYQLKFQVRADFIELSKKLNTFKAKLT